MNNLKIWEKVQETDPKYTKKDFGGFTSINGIYLVKKATEVFGPLGLGWGYDILEERYDDGIGFVVKDVGVVMSKTHTIKLELWYKQDKEICKVVNYGHTKAIYKTKNGYMVDDEAPKKSLTDAVKKCLSMLGFSSDIFMGQFEDRDYVEALERKSAIEHADDKDAERIKQAKEYQDWLSRELQAYDLIDDLKPLKTVYTGHMRKADRRGDEDGKLKLTKAYNKRKEELEQCK